MVAITIPLPVIHSFFLERSLLVIVFLTAAGILFKTPFTFSLNGLLVALGYLSYGIAIILQRKFKVLNNIYSTAGVKFHNASILSFFQDRHTRNSSGFLT